MRNKNIVNGSKPDISLPHGNLLQHLIALGSGLRKPPDHVYHSRRKLGTAQIHETASFFGNLYSGSPGFFDETETLKYYVNPDGEYHVKELDTGLESDSLYDMTWDSGIRNRYNVFLGGHFINTHITSNAKGGKALLLGDSYLMALVPFLADCYSEIRVLDMRQFGERGKTVAELIGDFKPDRILFVNTVYQLSCGASGGIK